MRAGAGGFLLKDAEPADLLRGIRVVAGGEALLSLSVTRRLIEAYAATPQPTAPSARLLGVLTDREREIVALAGTSRRTPSARLRQRAQRTSRFPADDTGHQNRHAECHPNDPLR